MLRKPDPRWNLREPRYELSGLHYGPVEPTTVLEPRIAPTLFGLGLLEAVSGPQMHSPLSSAEAGHFNWQGTAHSIVEQTTRAFSREMGLTTSVLPRDDCTPTQVVCGQLSTAAAVPEVQEELLWFCEAAHMPVIWATQVLESLAKTGQPSRAEITDAAMGERAECVMLNKGPHIVEAVIALDNILRRMQDHQTKKSSRLRLLHLNLVQESEEEAN